jgi:cytochrome c biogenesis protein CcdA
MTEAFASLASALWLGILTSISPCPLASNVAAVSYVGRNADDPGRVLLAGLVYSAGRALTYVLVGALVVASILSVPSVSFFLQQRMNQILGPLLVVIGVGILGWIPVRLPSTGFSDAIRERAAGRGVVGAGVLGILFALSFCPVSAGLFFGGLIPLAISTHSHIVLPAVYGVGTGLPVVLFAVLLALGARGVARAFHVLTGFERVARVSTGVIFIGAGVYLILTHLLGVSI